MNLENKISAYLDKLASKKYNKSLLQILIFSEKNKLNIKKSNIDPNQPFHVASVGKMFTATLIGMLVEEKLIALDDKITDYLPKSTLSGLFVHEGKDFQNDVTVRQLLGHTSGVADYFESDTNTGPKFVDMLLNQPEKKWTPAALLDFSRHNQKSFGTQGDFHYSDTGYILLGMIIEKITGKSFDNALNEMIFRPLGMSESYLMFYGQKRQEITPIWFRDVEISRLNILSCDWAGGGIVSTLDDLLKFQKALWSDKLVGREFVDEMSNMVSKFRPGIHYGLGMMEFRFEGFLFLLRGLPRPKGHTGIMGTFMFYDKENDTHIILNLGSNKKIPSGVRLFIKIESLIAKYVKSRQT